MKYRIEKGEGIVRVGSENRIANLAYQCVVCGVWKHAYVKPKNEIPRTCSKSCTLKYAWANRDYLHNGIRRGEDHAGWLGDAAKPRTGRCRAQRLYPRIGPCVRCGKKKAERHHKNGNTLDNRPENIEALCRRCHMDEDGRLQWSREHAKTMHVEGNKARWHRE